MKYLPVSVYRSNMGDCTNKGVTFTDEGRLLVPCPNGFITKDAAAKGHWVILEVGEAGGRMHFRPPNPNNDWLMFGGNFVYTSDSRFTEMYGGWPIHVHDRRE